LLWTVVVVCATAAAHILASGFNMLDEMEQGKGVAQAYF
jgi:hypothetical protein